MNVAGHNWDVFVNINIVYMLFCSIYVKQGKQ